MSLSEKDVHALNQITTDLVFIWHHRHAFDGTLDEDFYTTDAINRTKDLMERSRQPTNLLDGFDNIRTINYDLAQRVLKYLQSKQRVQSKQRDQLDVYTTRLEGIADEITEFHQTWDLHLPPPHSAERLRHLERELLELADPPGYPDRYGTDKLKSWKNQMQQSIRATLDSLATYEERDRALWNERQNMYLSPGNLHSLERDWGRRTVFQKESQDAEEAEEEEDDPPSVRLLQWQSRQTNS